MFSYRGGISQFLPVVTSEIHQYLTFHLLQAFKDPLSIKEYLERNTPLSENDLVPRRFSPVDYGQPFTEAVICPYSGCPFSTGDGEAMKHHQQETRHPGWGRCEEKPVDKKWICPKEVCGASFLAWDHLYRHMMVHSRPLGCTVCPFGAAKSTRLKRHMKESGHDSATKADESHVHWKRKRGSSVLKEQ